MPIWKPKLDHVITINISVVPIVASYRKLVAVAKNRHDFSRDGRSHIVVDSIDFDWPVPIAQYWLVT